MIGSSLPTYVLITAARNEEAFIERTLQSVTGQTVLPKRWIIVNDGSTDHTGEIIQRFASTHDWMECFRRPVHADRHFASKANSVMAGYQRLSSDLFDIVGSLDADLSFDKDYMEYLLFKFSQDPQLGVAGTPFIENSGRSYDYRFTSIEHVSGACQLFRRACFESIGGYRPIREGGIDWVAVNQARLNGWKTRTFTDKHLVHYRRMGTGNKSRISASFSLGRQDYYLGNHPLWELMRAVYQMRYSVTGGLILMSGYVYAALQRERRPIPLSLIAFIRKEQMDRLKQKVGLLRRHQKIR